MIETERLSMVSAAPQHAAGLAAYYRRNAEHLLPWEPRRSDDFSTEAYQVARLERDRENEVADRGYHFLAFTRERPDELAAAINVSNVVRGVFQAAHLGYSIDVDLQGRGLATEAVGAVVEQCFATLRLHRVMANYHPDNERSSALLGRLGFLVEGFAPKYLYINGMWRDSVLSAKTNPDPNYVP